MIKLCVMAGVMLLFAFSMSFVVNLVENKMNPGDEFTGTVEPEETVQE